MKQIVATVVPGTYSGQARAQGRLGACIIHTLTARLNFTPARCTKKAEPLYIRKKAAAVNTNECTLTRMCVYATTRRDVPIPIQT